MGKERAESIQLLHGLSDQQFNRVRAAAKDYFYHDSGRYFIADCAKNHHVSTDQLKAATYIVTPSGIANGYGSLTSRGENRKVVKEAFDKWFREEFKRRKLNSCPYLRDYVDDYRQIVSEKGARLRQQKFQKEENHQQQKINNRQPRTRSSKDRPNNMAVQTSARFTRKGVFCILLVVLLVIGMAYDNGPIQAQAQLISLAGVVVLSLLFNDSEIGWRRYFLLLISFECLADHPILAILSVFFVVPVLGKGIFQLVRNLVARI